jgi:CBS domain-containing protein
MTTLAPQRLAVPLDEATVADAMSAGVIHCAPETPRRSVARLMATHNVHAVYVFDYGQEDDASVRLWGLISDLDLVAACPVLDARTAGSSAVTPLVTVSLLEQLTRAAQLMTEQGTAHLAVIDPATGRPVGVLSTLDIARVVASGQGGREVQASS